MDLAITKWVDNYINNYFNMHSVFIFIFGSSVQISRIHLIHLFFFFSVLQLCLSSLWLSLLLMAQFSSVPQKNKQKKTWLPPQIAGTSCTLVEKDGQVCGDAFLFCLAGCWLSGLLSLHTLGYHTAQSFSFEQILLIAGKMWGEICQILQKVFWFSLKRITNPTKKSPLRPICNSAEWDVLMNVTAAFTSLSRFGVTDGFSFYPLLLTAWCVYDSATNAAHGPKARNCTGFLNCFRNIWAEQCDFCPTVTNLARQEKSICPALRGLRRIRVWIMFRHIVFASLRLKIIQALHIFSSNRGQRWVVKFSL